MVAHLDDLTAVLRHDLGEASKRPGMYGLREDYHVVVAWVMGCSIARPDLFDALGPWAVARLDGARDKYGWWGPLAVLAAARVAEGKFRQDREPLAGAFVALVCEYLDDLAERGEGTIRADYERILASYSERHSAAHAASGVGTDDKAAWDEVCRTWHEAAIPALRHAPDPGKPWDQVQNTSLCEPSPGRRTDDLTAYQSIL